MKAIPKTGINGSPSAVQSAGTADQVSEQEQIKVCPHQNAGCISQNGYLCLHNGPCEPIDNRGRWFAVMYSTDENGQTYMHREYRQQPVAVSVKGDKCICGEVGGRACMCQPEDHAGKGACGKAVLGSFSPKTNPADVIAS
jgi:hypothetical protein